MSAPAPADWPRTLRLAGLAFLIGLLGVGVGGALTAFLWVAWHHGGL